MNVQDAFSVMDQGGLLIAPLGSTSINQLLTMRKTTYQGFATLEQEKGFLRPTASYATTHGQEMIRVLLMRFFEELTEAHTSIDEDHKLEELIDAINYLWSLCILDESCPIPWDVVLLEGLDGIQWGESAAPDQFEIGQLVLYSTWLLSSLRNRAWQHNPQSLYFDGWKHLRDFVIVATKYVAMRFADWDQFVRFFLAKDSVLQFRLRTKY